MYPTRKALNTVPICVWVRPNSRIMLGATTVTATRHTYPTEAAAISSSTSRLFSEVDAVAVAGTALMEAFCAR